MVARVRCVRAVGSRSTMSELFEAWFATAVDGWSPSTVRQNRSVLDCHLHRHIGSVVVGDVTPALIDALYVRLRRGDNGARPLAAATVARIHVVMSSAFSQAMRWGWVWDNPASRAHRIVVPTNEMRTPTPAELKSLLEFVASRDRQLELFLRSLRWPGRDVHSCSGCGGATSASPRDGSHSAQVGSRDQTGLSSRRRRRNADTSSISMNSPANCSPTGRQLRAVRPARHSSSATTTAPQHGSRTG